MRNWAIVFSLHLFLEEMALPTQVFYFLINLIRHALTVLEIAMLVRAVLSWVAIGSDGSPSRLYGFFTLITEPIVLPFRKICSLKYDSMGLEFPYGGLPEPTKEQMRQLEQVLAAVHPTVIRQ